MLCLLLQEVTEFMFDHDVLNIRRRELLHHKWTDRVYDPIQKHVLSQMTGTGYKDLLLYKRLLYAEFLAKGNRKVFLFVCLPVLSNALTLYFIHYRNHVS